MNTDSSDVSLLLASRQGEKGYEAYHFCMAPGHRLRDGAGNNTSHPGAALRNSLPGRAKRGEGFISL